MTEATKLSDGMLKFALQNAFTGVENAQNIVRRHIDALAAENARLTAELAEANKQLAELRAPADEEELGGIAYTEYYRDLSNPTRSWMNASQAVAARVRALLVQQIAELTAKLEAAERELSEIPLHPPKYCENCGSCGCGGCCPHYCSACKDKHDGMSPDDREPVEVFTRADRDRLAAELATMRQEWDELRRVCFGEQPKALEQDIRGLAGMIRSGIMEKNTEVNQARHAEKVAKQALAAKEGELTEVFRLLSVQEKRTSDNAEARFAAEDALAAKEGELAKLRAACEPLVEWLRSDSQDMSMSDGEKLNAYSEACTKRGLDDGPTYRQVRNFIAALAQPAAEPPQQPRKLSDDTQPGDYIDSKGLNQSAISRILGSSFTVLKNKPSLGKPVDLTPAEAAEQPERRFVCPKCGESRFQQHGTIELDGSEICCLSRRCDWAGTWAEVEAAQAKGAAVEGTGIGADGIVYDWQKAYRHERQRAEAAESSAAAMREALQIADAHIFWSDCTLENVHARIRAVLATDAGVKLLAEMKRLRDVLTRIYGWDVMDAMDDGRFWRSEIDKALGREQATKQAEAK